MNPRIKLLAEQAELNATLLFNKDKLEKFAELIVGECAEIVDKKISPPSHPMNSIGFKLKEHFGVEHD
jgi:hypothetical protein